jgi:heat shock protein HslJ
MTILDPELRELLHRIDDLAPPAPPLPHPPAEATAPRAVRPSRPRIVAALACVVLVTATVVGIVITRGGRSTTTESPTLADLRTALDGDTWTLTAIDGTPTTAQMSLTADNQRDISGRLGCNSLGFDPSADRPPWIISMTLAACRGEDVIADSLAMNALQHTTSITHDVDTLVLRSADGHSLTFHRVSPITLANLRTALGNTTWTLTAVDGTRTTLPFTLGVLDRAAVGGKIDCNDYSLDDTTPSSKARWIMDQTAVGCPGNNAEPSSHVTEILVNTSSVNGDGTALVLTDTKGRTLRFEPAP